MGMADHQNQSFPPLLWDQTLPQGSLEVGGSSVASPATPRVWQKSPVTLFCFYQINTAKTRCVSRSSQPQGCDSCQCRKLWVEGIKCRQNGDREVYIYIYMAQCSWETWANLSYVAGIPHSFHFKAFSPGWICLKEHHAFWKLFSYIFLSEHTSRENPSLHRLWWKGPGWGTWHLW